MRTSMLLVGDTKLGGVTDPRQPFSLIEDLLRSEPVVFGNLEGALYDEIDPYEYHAKVGWTHAGTAGAGALRVGNFAAVGLANNVIIGAEAIRSTLTILDDLGVPHTGAGLELQAARAPVILERNGVRFGFLQRTSIAWPFHHKAVPDGPVLMPESFRYVHADARMSPPGSVFHFQGAPGVATIRARTAYEPNLRSMFEAGGDALIHTWPDPAELDEFIEDVASLRPQVDILVTSHHWRLTGGDIVRDYRREIAHSAIEAGADLVIGHGTHQIEEIETYQGKAIFYGLGNFFFQDSAQTVPGNRLPAELLRRHPLDGSGLIVQAEVAGRSLGRVACQVLRPVDGADVRPSIARFETDGEYIDVARASMRRFGTDPAVSEDTLLVI